MERVLFLTLLILFPINLAKRFVTPFAYIQGMLVDYLLPTIYATELFVLALLVLAFIRSFISSRLKMERLLFLFPLLVLLPSLLTSENPFFSFFRFSELLLWIGFGLWVSRNVVWEREKKRITLALSLGVSWVSLLALAQFLAQRNIFGYFPLGEPLLYPSLGGVAKTSFLGKEVLRAYGTFPHPNVLGGTMSLIIPWLLSGGYFLPAGLAFLGLLVSFSKLAWLSLFFGLFFLVFSKTRDIWQRMVAGVFLIIVPLVLVSFPLLFNELSVVRRVDLLQSAWGMVGSSPFVGIGLGLFSAKLPTFGLPSGPTLFLQPVHNIFALVAAESGLFALGAFLLVFVLAARKVWRRKRLLLLISLSQLVFLGFFDHYLYTLPQGLFLFSLTFGFIFSYSIDNGRPAHA